MTSLAVIVPDIISSSPKTIDPHATSFFFTLDLFLALSSIAGTALSASSGKHASIFNPLLLYNTQSTEDLRRQATCVQLQLVFATASSPISTFWLTRKFYSWSPNPRSWPSHLLLHRLHRNSCPQPVSESLTTKPVLHLHLLSLSDFDTLSHAIVWGEEV